MRHAFLVPVLLMAAFSPCAARQILVTEAGAGPTGLPRAASSLGLTGALNIGPSGDILVLTDGRLFRVDTSGIVQVVAGEGVNCTFLPYGDGAIARRACLASVSNQIRTSGKGIARDASGNIYIADTGHHAIRKIDGTTGLINLWAGNYVAAYGGDGGPASQASLRSPHDIVFDGAGNMLIADRGNHRIRRVSAATGLITTVAGNGSPTAPGGDPGDGLPALQATLNLPFGVAVDAAGNIYIGDTGNYRVRKVSATTGIITTIAGNGTPGYSGDNVAGTAATLAGPAGLAMDSGGNLLIADSGDLLDLLPEEDLLNHHVRRLDLATGIITTIAGTDGFGFGGPVGDGGPATSGALYRPSHAISDLAGNIYIADQFHKLVRKVSSASGIIDTLAGNGTTDYAGDGFPARLARFANPGPLEFDAAGNLYVSDRDNSRVRQIHAATGLVATVAGNGIAKTSGDGGPATAAGIMSPEGMAFDASGNLYIADSDGNRIRKVAAGTGIITTVAGNGLYGYAGDGGPATAARLAYPLSVAVDTAGNILIADTGNNRIRKVAPATGVITTVAGTGWGYHELDGAGGDPADEINDGGQATGAAVTFPLDVVVDASNDVLIADWELRVRKVDSDTGTISTVAGTGLTSQGGDGGLATSAGVSPDLLALDQAGNLFLVSRYRVRRVDAATRIITTVLGGDTYGAVPDGWSAAMAPIGYPAGLAVDGSGSVHYSEPVTYRIRTTAPLPGASRVPDGRVAGEKPLTVTRSPNGDLTLSWGPSCLATDFDYAIYEGQLGSFPSHTARFCTTAGATGKTFAPGPGSMYYLVVPRNSLEEGSHGLSSDGAERLRGPGVCAPQQVAATCTE
jgi:sugar lactone lactonase YvrE